MYKSEPKGNSTLTNRTIMIYEIKAGTVGTHKSIGSFKIQFWSWFKIPLKRINYIPMLYVNNNKTKLKSMSYYPQHATSYV